MRLKTSSAVSSLNGGTPVRNSYKQTLRDHQFTGGAGAGTERTTVFWYIFIFTNHTHSRIHFIYKQENLPLYSFVVWWQFENLYTTNNWIFVASLWLNYKWEKKNYFPAQNLWFVWSHVFWKHFCGATRYFSTRHSLIFCFRFIRAAVARGRGGFVRARCWSCGKYTSSSSGAQTRCKRYCLGRGDIRCTYFTSRLGAEFSHYILVPPNIIHIESRSVVAFWWFLCIGAQTSRCCR